MARARATTNSRLTVDDWVQAGFAILAEEGIKAMKIDRLCRRLDVTKGSFYWHFTDIAGYRAALVHRLPAPRGPRAQRPRGRRPRRLPRDHAQDLTPCSRLPADRNNGPDRDLAQLRRPVSILKSTVASGTVGQIETIVADLLAASGASAHFRDTRCSGSSGTSTYLPVMWCSTTTPAMNSPVR
jgi:AcrR family transcriptional regulator